MRFGSYTFPGTFQVSTITAGNRLGTAAVPERDGLAVGSPFRRERTIKIEGRLYSSTSIRDVLDTLLASLYTGRQKLYLGQDTDRYIYAILTGHTDTYPEGLYGLFCDVELEFLCDSPYFESETESSDVWDTSLLATPIVGDTRDISVGGNAPTWPILEMVVSGSGTLDVSLARGDDSFTLNGDVSDGEVLVIDCEQQTVTRQSDGEDRMSLFDGQFLKFVGNSTNTLVYTDWAGSPTISQITVRWRDRWH